MLCKLLLRSAKSSQYYFSTAKPTIAPSPNKPLFRFGLISDTQYADIDDDFNFQKTKMRRHRQSLEILRSAVSSFNHRNVDFSILLGDTVDGKAAGLGIQQRNIDDIFSLTKTMAQSPFHYAFGNHDYYCFNRQQLFRLMSPHFLSPSSYIGGGCSPNRLYYDFSPAVGWRVLMIDSYDVSLIGYSSPTNLASAQQILAKNNPNDLNVSGGWFKNLPVDKYRYVPYNGGVSAEQLRWLEEVVSKSAQAGEQLICFSHQPIYAPTKPQSLIWNAEELLAILHKYGNTKLWMAGHDHDGQYAIDGEGVHHLVPPAPLECEYGEKAFGVMEVFEDCIGVDWTGKLPKEPVLPWSRRLAFQLESAL